MPLVSLDQVKDKSFDYVIAGGGTAGLVIASRLSEDPFVTVLVLDAGSPNAGEPLILRPGQFGLQFFNPKFDWAFKTVPQKHADGIQYNWHRGKSLGGSSAINFSAWTVPPKGDIDDWERLGNEGWNWNNYEKYLSRAVTYTPLDLTAPDTIGRDKESLKIWDINKHPLGTGPLNVAHPRKIFDIDAKAYEAFLNMGIPRSPAPCHGDPTGVYISLNTVDPKLHTRTYSSSAYFDPISTRSNLSVLTSAYVHRIVTESGDGELRATGVEFSYGGGPAVHVAYTNREIIVSAGALKSPQILELSGIGRPDVLSKIGVPVKVALDGVGENVQEHQWLGVTYEVKEGVSTETYDLLRDEKEAAKHLELYTKAEGIYMTGINNFVFMSLHDFTSKADAIYEAEKAKIAEDIKNNKYPPGLAEQYEIQLERIRDRRTGPEIATVPGFLSTPKPPSPGKQYFTIVGALNHNFSRGTIHATSDDPLANPEMDPHYFEHDIDRQVFIALVQYIRQVMKTEPLSEFLVDEVNPGPEFSTDEQLANWVPQGCASTWHTAGSLSMLPREKNGVVDAKLKVYGTQNIRVVDLSIVPLHFSAHSQATVYTIAEQAAQIIKDSATRP